MGTGRVRIRDLTGRTFGGWTALTEAAPRRGVFRYWLCQCECGVKREVKQSGLLCGETTSCGCRREALSTVRATTHGRTKTKEYRAWHSMKDRCLNPRMGNYPRYGGRGIQICDRWLHSFENFLADMGEAPTAKHSLDRINNDLHYSPDNCRWALSRQQGNNRGDNHRLEYQGETKTLTEWARSRNMLHETLQSRLYRYHWSLEKALNTPVKKYNYTAHYRLKLRSP